MRSARGCRRRSRGRRFGSPIWKAGKKTFVSRALLHGPAEAVVLGRGPRQKKLVKDKRFRISKYTGHSGWIDLDVEEEQDWEEIRELLVESYRQFALKRMVKELRVD